GAAGIPRQLVVGGKLDDPGGDTLLQRQGRHDIAIAAIVAGAAKDRDLIRIRPAFEQRLEGGATRALHQHQPGDAAFLNGEAVEFANLARGVERIGESGHGKSAENRRSKGGSLAELYGN